MVAQLQAYAVVDDEGDIAVVGVVVPLGQLLSLFQAMADVA